jgi:hypothetical protein
MLNTTNTDEKKFTTVNTKLLGLKFYYDNQITLKKLVQIYHVTLTTTTQLYSTQFALIEPPGLILNPFG